MVYYSGEGKKLELTWLKEIGLDTDMGLSYTGRPDKYLSAIYRFYKNYGNNKEKADTFYGAGDHENYRIVVHALKSNARMIGAETLSSDFEKLEKAAAEADIALIRQEHERVMSEYAALIKKISPIEEMSGSSAADEISAEAARKIADRLLTALDEFDEEEAKRLAQELSGYPFRMTQEKRLKEAIAYIDDFMYDEPAEIIREIISAIE